MLVRCRRRSGVAGALPAVCLCRRASMSEADCIMRVLRGVAGPGRPEAAEVVRGGVHCVVLLMWSMYSRRPSC